MNIQNYEEKTEVLTNFDAENQIFAQILTFFNQNFDFSNFDNPNFLTTKIFQLKF